MFGYSVYIQQTYEIPKHAPHQSPYPDPQLGFLATLNCCLCRMTVEVLLKGQPSNSTSVLRAQDNARRKDARMWVFKRVESSNCLRGSLLLMWLLDPNLCNRACLNPTFSRPFSDPWEKKVYTGWAYWYYDESPEDRHIPDCLCKFMRHFGLPYLEAQGTQQLFMIGRVSHVTPARATISGVRKHRISSGQKQLYKWVPNHVNLQGLPLGGAQTPLPYMYPHVMTPDVPPIQVFSLHYRGSFFMRAQLLPSIPPPLGSPLLSYLKLCTRGTGSRGNVEGGSWRTEI